LKEDAGYGEYVETMTELFHKFEQSGRVLMPYITYIYHGVLK
jgi:hypothetical protein